MSYSEAGTVESMEAEEPETVRTEGPGEVEEPEPVEAEEPETVRTEGPGEVGEPEPVEAEEPEAVQTESTGGVEELNRFGNNTTGTGSMSGGNAPDDSAISARLMELERWWKEWQSQFDELIR